MFDIKKELTENPYPGRGIIVGRDHSGENAVIAYFIMGRSENSRNRIFVEDGDGIKTQAYDESKMTDPSLIIYSPLRVYENTTVVTNGDQTDTVVGGLQEGKSFKEALMSRTFEPDGPNFTPRISAALTFEKGGFSYEMSILKSEEGDERSALRFTYSFETPMPGRGRFIHTYSENKDPLPSFLGDPKPIEIDGDIDDFTNMLWESLNEENKVSLYVRYINLSSGKWESRLKNKHN